ncbi:unnamed protein product [Lymnaea stagnalis]|uniref:Uncharacterized protein n=1 Tax=Lymnaea stagnalis TaxID=6523 RepID=A0AAV2HTQ3_LYMST
MEEASRLSRSGVDAMTTAGPGPERRTSTFTTVQITPIKASPEMKNAIRRQRRMVGIGYAPSGLPSQRVFKPVYRAVLPGGVQPNSTQYTIITSHSLSGRDVTDDLNGVHQRDTVDDEMETTANSAIPKYGSDVKTLRVNNGGYSVIYEKRVHLQGDKMVSPRGEADNAMLTSTPASLRLTLAPNHHRQLNMVRSVTSDHLTGRNPMVSNMKPFLDDSRISSESWQRGNHVFLTQSRRGHINMTFQGQEHGFAENSRKTDPQTIMQPDITDAESAPATEKPDTGNIHQKHNMPREMPCVDFANSIISAVNSDLNQVYQLCHARVKYSDIIEKAQPHRLNDNASTRGGATSKLSIGAPNTGVPNQLSFFSPTSAASSSPLTSPRRSQLFPNLLVKPSRQVFSNKSALEFDTSSWSTTYPGQDFKKEFSESSQTSAPEPVVDYDKSDTFVIEFNGNASPNSKRPILKHTLKTTNTGDTYGKTPAGDVNNNSNSSSTDTFPTVTAGQGSRNGNTGVSTSTFNLQARRKLPENAGPTAGSREKGRLVRFNADPKIHEFTPSEPVVPSKFPQTDS